MRDIQQRLIQTLADGEFHSGETLAKQFGLTRVAIWNHVKLLADYGLDVHSVRGKGHRMARAFTPLDATQIRDQLKDSELKLASFTIKHSIDSTNRYLADMTPPPAGKVHVCLAEQQTGGRGRRGRQWHSPYGAGIYLSLAQRLAVNDWPMGGLGLALGVAVHQALTSLGIAGIKLKWPNDLMVGYQKLGGLLIEASQLSNDSSYVVIGIGINVDLPMDLKLQMQALTPSPITLADIDQDFINQRNQMVALLIENCLQACEQFAEQGLLPSKAYWQRFDYLGNHELQVEIGNQVIVGRSCGVADDGQLVIENTDGLQHNLAAGDVTVRRTFDIRRAA
ncbi:MAG: biotin--[acetyl-CoA-carboxylase] ligase [Gammaproteobacteria bacterium]|nr:biotin--[acetyl-CoA-carboxylase] ligase [Gammaproteobacteria bacterium]